MDPEKTIRIKIVLAWLNLPRLIPHIILFLLNVDRFREDVIRNVFTHSPSLTRSSLLQGFIYLIVFDKYYRNLYYHRIGYLRYFISFLAPPCSHFLIGVHTRIGEGCRLVHPFSTIINAESIGKNFEIRNNVTIGVKVSGGRRPIIKDSVVINANSVIIGELELGNKVVVGAGAVVTKSVPENCVVVGNPAFILKENGQRVDREL